MLNLDSSARGHQRLNSAQIAKVFATLFLSFFVLSSVSPRAVFAQSRAPIQPGINSDSGPSVLKLPELKPESSSALKLKPHEKKIFGQIRIENLQYITELKAAPDLTNTQLLSARLSGADNFENHPQLSYGVDLTAGTYFSWRHSHGYVNEAYLKSDFSELNNLSIGRRKFEWSELDTRWQLGLWQPKFNLNPLRPEDQGLTGLFFDHREEKQEFLLLATPIFLPTTAPEVREEGGSLVSDSRWYRAPSNKWKFNNQDTPNVYSLETPEVARLTGNPGFAGMYRVGALNEGPRMIVAAAYKPVNDMLLKRQIDFFTNNLTQVKVSPDVTYHRLISTDVAYSWGPFNASVSYLGDDPVEKRPIDKWAIQKLKPLSIYSANFDMQLSSLVARPLSLQTSYLKVFGGEIEDIEKDGSPNEITLFDSRTKFTNAVLLSLQGEIWHPYSRPLTSKFSYTYDYDQKGYVWGLEFQLSPVKQWGLVLGSDILGVENETDTDKRFINQFRANDRYYAGLSYVF